MTEKGQRIEKVMTYLKLNKNSFSKEIGMSSNVTIGRILNEDRNPHPSTLQKIVDRFPQIDYEWLLTGEGSMLKDLPGSTNSENTNQKSDDMIHDNFFQALKRRDKQIDEMLAQQSRLIGVIERLHGITDAGARISPPLQNQGQDCLK